MNITEHYIKFSFAGWSGWDAFVAKFLTKKMEVRRIARKITHPRTGPYKGHDPEKANLLIEMPYGTYRVSGRNGEVEEHRAVVTPMG